MKINFIPRLRKLFIRLEMDNWITGNDETGMGLGKK